MEDKAAKVHRVAPSMRLPVSSSSLYPCFNDPKRARFVRDPEMFFSSSPVQSILQSFFFFLHFGTYPVCAFDSRVPFPLIFFARRDNCSRKPANTLRRIISGQVHRKRDPIKVYLCLMAYGSVFWRVLSFSPLLFIFSFFLSARAWARAGEKFDPITSDGIIEINLNKGNRSAFPL